MTLASYRESSLEAKDGLKLYFRDYHPDATGATPLLCLHGLTRNSKDFEDLAPGLAVKRRVIVPDMRGRGQSAYDPDYANYQVPTYAADVLALLDSLEIAQTVIIGTSMGGLIAMALAALRPACLAGVVLNDIGPEIDPRGLARIARTTGQIGEVKSWTEAAAQIRDINEEAFPDYGPDDWMAFARRTFRQMPSGAIAVDYDPRIGDAMRENETSAAPANLWPLFETLKPIPLLAIRGDISDILSRETLEKMALAHPGMKEAVIAGRGHAPSLQEPQSLAAIHDFIKTL